MPDEKLVEYIRFTSSHRVPGFPPHHTGLKRIRRKTRLLRVPRCRCISVRGAHNPQVHRMNICPKWLSLLRLRTSGGRCARHGY